MIRVYFLLVEIIDGTEQVLGVHLIHGALLDCTEQPDVRKLIMDTNQDEHFDLEVCSLSWHEATQEELDRYHAEVIIIPPDPDTIRAEEILETSPAVITQPEIWELLRILGRRLGYRT